MTEFAGSIQDRSLHSDKGETYPDEPSELLKVLCVDNPELLTKDPALARLVKSCRNCLWAGLNDQIPVALSRRHWVETKTEKGYRDPDSGWVAGNTYYEHGLTWGLRVGSDATFL